MHKSTVYVAHKKNSALPILVLKIPLLNSYRTHVRFVRRRVVCDDRVAGVLTTAVTTAAATL